ncbi:MAG: ABC transporter substrate-binding protein [Gemmatimonadaceae bacterium]|nr:ABC transporter substrate-binding protein [Acetobacteraceae bacterium]
MIGSSGWIVHRSIEALRPRSFFSAVLLIVLAAGCAKASAADLRVGIKADPTIDPHFLYLAPNIAIARHMFDPLVGTDASARAIPRLAVSWKALSDTEWEFKLRPGVRFHDGSLLTADDVVFSFSRVRTLPNNPNSYAAGLRSISSVTAVDPATVRITTDAPNPVLPVQVRIISIVSATAALGAMPADFASGRAAVGTGPFRFAQFQPGDRLTVRRNEQYWGPAPAWDTVTFRVLANDSARVAALLARDVDAIDVVPPRDAARLRQTQGIEVFTRESDRIIYLALNSLPERMTWFTDRAGAPLDRNPFRDARVRLAVSKAIDRRALVERGVDGLGVPAAQMAPSGFDGFDPTAQIEIPDPAGARALLTDAGYPNGFGITLHCPNGRYVNDSGICQLLGSMLSRVGIMTQVDAQPPSMFFTRIRPSDLQSALMMIGWGLGGGSALSALTDAMHSYDTGTGLGANTRGTNSPEMDGFIKQASREFDAERRTSLMLQAMAVSRRDTIVVPLYAEMTVLAARKGITIEPRADQQTIVTGWQSAP